MSEFDNFNEEQETVKRNVKKLMERFKECRNPDDNVLVTYYHYYFDGLDKFIPLDTLKKITKMSSISRSRRKIQEESRTHLRRPLTDKQKEYWEQFLPSEATEELLQIREQEFKEHYRKREETW